MAIEHRSALGAGYRLYEYQIESVLGHGGFGITYLATDTNLRNKVAIKEFLPMEVAVRVDGSTVEAKSSDDQETFQWGLERFTQEAQTLARFRHPNVIQISRYFEANNTAYFVMDYEDGASLKSIMDKAGKLSQSELEEILHPLLDGLEAVHKKGVLHRDIKPGNIYIRKDGTPVLLDFGAARQALGNKSRSLTSIFTAGYAPYEQYYSDGDQGIWTDIYAFAAVLYRGVTGKPPPEAPGRVRNDPMAPAAEAGKNDYSADFLTAIDAGLAFYPEDRPQDIGAWRAMFLGGEAVTKGAAETRRKQAEKTVTPTVTARKTGSSSSLKWVLVGGLGAAAVVLVVAAVLLIPADEPGGGGSSIAGAGATGQGATAGGSTGGGQAGAGSAAGGSTGRGQAGAGSAAGGGGSTGVTSISVADPPRQRCDELAADPWDAKKKSNGVRLSRIGAGAADSCRQAASAFPNSPRMAANYARVLFRGGRNEEAVKWARRSSRGGSGSGAFHLGVAYHSGIGVGKNLTEARRWYKTGANRGHALASYRLGTFQITGTGGPANASQGAGNLKRAAKRGVVIAQWRLGEVLTNGTGISRNYQRAVFWYAKAAQSGHPKAQASLAFAYLNGRGVAKDIKLAGRWYRKAAAQGNARAYYEIGRFYEFGIGAAINLPLALAYYNRAAGKGHAGAENNLGTLYYNGKGVAKNYAIAARWFRRAANRGDAVAQNWLGLSYSKGRGVPKSLSKSYFWLALAVRRGGASARALRDKIAVHLTAAQRRALDARVVAWRPNG